MNSPGKERGLEEDLLGYDEKVNVSDITRKGNLFISAGSAFSWRFEIIFSDE